MMAHRFRAAFLLTVLVLVAGGVDAQQRRWVIVDQRQDGDPGLGFLSNHEGFERARAAQQGQPQTTFQVGGNFTNFLANVADGDELVVIAHGVLQRNADRSIARTGFAWAGQPFFTFGNGGGATEMPLPANFNQRQNVRVTFCTCFSARDPDGGGQETPLTTKLREAMGPAGNNNTVTGFTNAAQVTNVVGVGAGGTAAQRTAARNAITNNRNDWNRRPPRNRPGTGGPTTPDNQFSRGQALIDAAVGQAGVVPFDLPAAIGTRGAGGARGYAAPIEGAPPPPKPAPGDGTILQDEEFVIDDCLGDCPEGCGIATSILQGDAPVAVEIALISAHADVDGIQILWSAASGDPLEATVYRRQESTGWAAMGIVRADARGRLVFTDRDVVPGRRYGYVLAVREDGVEHFAGETWLDVPAARLELRGVQPNPAARAFTLAFTLPRAGAALLEAHDVSGRLVLRRELSGLHAGAHWIPLSVGDVRLTAGVYTVRLTQAGRSVSTKMTILR